MVNIWHTGNFPYGEKLPDIKNIDSRYCAHRNTPLDLESVTSRPTLQSPLSIFLQFLCLRRIASVSEELQVKFYVHFCRVSVCGMSPWSHPPPLYNLLLPAAFRPISLCKYNFFSEFLKHAKFCQQYMWPFLLLPLRNKRKSNLTKQLARAI